MADDKEHNASILEVKATDPSWSQLDKDFHTEPQASGLQTLAAARMRSNHKLIALCPATSQQT